MRSRALPALVGIISIVLAAACRPGEAIQPHAGTAGGALGETSCQSVGANDQPLVIDWKAHERSNLEEQMSDGVAVVHYECGSLRLLPRCHVDGSYKFLATSRKEQVIKLEDKDDIAANLPTTGTFLAGKFGASLDRGASLDLAMVLVGKLRTTVTEANVQSLRGGAACAGATHFVRAAFVGAFALATGTRGEATAVAQVVEASSKSSALASYRDGDVAACKNAHEGDAAAPSGCNALVRLELVAIDGAKTAAAEGSCPTGFAMLEGKCTKKAAAAPHLCNEDDEKDCTLQCDNGHMASCHRLGRMYLDGEGGIAKDPKRAVALFKRACDANFARACGSLGYLHGQGVGVPVDKARAAELFRIACDAADFDPMSCVNLGIVLKQGEGVIKDEARAATLHRKACDAGSAAGCCGLGLAYAFGSGVPQDELRATALFVESCNGGFGTCCFNAGNNYEHGKGVAYDIDRAIEFYKKGCAVKHNDSCESLDYFHVKH